MKKAESHHPKKLSETVQQKVIEVAKKYLEISSRYAVGKICGVSATSVGKILRKYGLAGKKEEQKQDKPMQTYEWLRKNICWSIDAVRIKFKGWLLYLLVLRDEYARLPLSTSISMTNSAFDAAELVKQTIRALKVKPVMVKKDRGSEFKGSEFQDELREEGIVDFTGPGYYPKFNGKHERGNKIFAKLQKLFYGKDVGLLKFLETVKEAVDFEANILPRMMFNGKTSREVYDEAKDYTADERQAFLARLLEVKTENERKKEQLKNDMLDVQRICIVKSARDVNLLEVRMRENANQLSV